MIVGQTLVDCVSGIGSMATRHVLTDLAAIYGQRAGQHVSIESVGGVDAERRVRDGEAFDFVVLAARTMEDLTDAGLIDRATSVEIARSSMAIARPKGSPRVDLTTERGVRDALGRARSIAYSTGPSGRHVLQLLQRWGLADRGTPHLVEAPPGVSVGSLVARGDAEIGFQQLPELIHVPGIDVVAALPEEVQLVTVFTGGVCASSRHHQATRAWLSFCASAEANATKPHHGMQP